MVVDEGHRIKNHSSLLAQILSQVTAACKVLLTGTVSTKQITHSFAHPTLLQSRSLRHRSPLCLSLCVAFSLAVSCYQPIQNHLGELWSVLNFLDADEFPSESDFVDEYGEVANGSTAHLEALQQRIEPYFLRRIKEDVEVGIPPRRETLIEVDLTRSQKLHYKALYEKDVAKLMRGRGADLPSLMNLGMQLRKCCQVTPMNHNLPCCSRYSLVRQSVVCVDGGTDCPICAVLSSTELTGCMCCCALSC